MRAIVMEADGQKAVILKKDGSFETVRDRGYAVGQQISLKKQSFAPLRALAAAACLLLTIGASSLALLRMPVSYVYVDINPSIRLDINGLDRVVGIVPLNADAEDLLSAYPISENDPQGCIDEIIAACLAGQYLNENNTDVEISLCTDRTDLADSTLRLSAAKEAEGLEVSVYNLDSAENKKALQKRVSAKRLRAVAAYAEAFGGDPEDHMQALSDYSADEIYEAVRLQKRDGTGPLTPNRKQQGAGKSGSDRTGAKNGQQKNGKNDRIPKARMDAIRRYTDCFGGTAEENQELLRGLSTRRIEEEVRAYRQQQEASGDNTSP